MLETKIVYFTSVCIIAPFRIGGAVNTAEEVFRATAGFAGSAKYLGSGAARKQKVVLHLVLKLKNGFQDYKIYERLIVN